MKSQIHSDISLAKKPGENINWKIREDLSECRALKLFCVFIALSSLVVIMPNLIAASLFNYVLYVDVLRIIHTTH